MARILAIETATAACSVAIVEGERQWERFEVIPQGHTQRIFSMIREVLAEGGYALDDMEAIAVSRGPGSFTGVRIGIGVAQGLGYGLGKPVYPISTLAALAYQGREKEEDQAQEQLVCVLLDARMQEYYGAIYRVGAKGVEMIAPEQVLPYAVWREKGEMIPMMRWVENTLPRASAIAALAQCQWCAGDKGVPASMALPVYIRDKVTS